MKNELAFPQHTFERVQVNQNNKVSPLYELKGGLTKREYFAAMAMQAAVTADLPLMKSDVESCAKGAVHMADALIEELEK